MKDDPPGTPCAPDRSRSLQVRVVALYAVFAALWILGSDTVLDMLFKDRATVIQVSTYKGWLFVAITSALLYWQLRSPAGAQRQPPQPVASLRPWLLPFAGIFMLILVLVAAAMTASRRQHHDTAAAQLEAVAELRAGQLAQWVDERVTQARYAGEAPLGTSFARWRDSDDPDALERLEAGLSGFARASKARTVLIVDEHGRLLGPEGTISGPLPEELAPTVAAAIGAGSVQFDEPVGGNDRGGSRFDIVAPIFVNGTPLHAAVVFRLDPDDFLLRTLNQWPLPGRAGRSMLVRPDGRALLNSPAGSGPVAHAALADTSARAVDRLDARGEPVLSIARPVSGTPWLLVTSIPSAEVDAHARNDLLWIGAVGALAVFVFAIGMFLLRERLALQLKAAETHEQAQRLRALQLLQSIADSSTDLIYAKDQEGHYLLFNREASRASGMAAELVIGKYGHEVFPGAQSEQMKASDQRVMETGRPYSFEHEVDTVDGRRTYLSTKGLLRGPDGQATGVFGISRDITARLRVEQALRDSAELVQAVGDSILDHLAVLDVTGHIVAVNAAWREFDRHLAPADCRGLSRWQVDVDYLANLSRVGTPEAISARDGIARVLAGREPAFALEYCCSCDDHDEEWFVMKVTPLKIAGGGAVVVHSEITQLKRSAAEVGRYRDHLEELVAQRTEELEQSNRTLGESERFVRSMTDGMPAALAYWDRDLRCRFANRLLRVWFQLGWTAIIEMDLPAVVGPARFREIEPGVRAALQGTASQYSISRPDPAGRDKHYLVNFIPDVAQGQVQGFFLLASEITALRLAQLELEQANEALVVARDRAEAASRAKSAFLANMSHEIRTPMNAIIGFTELLKADSADPAQAQRLDHVSEAAQHLLSLINDILDLSKIESGRLKLEHTPFSLRDAVTRTVMLVSGQARAKGLELTVDLDAVPDALCGDPTRLAQAMLNLLGNAVKFTEQGEIGLRARVLEQSADDVLVRFEVHDTGIGIPADKLASLFKAFEQADSSTTRRFGGTGLGLALTRYLAQLMGGQADAHSVLGAGSTFWFTARLARSALAPAIGPEPEVLSPVVLPLGEAARFPSTVRPLGAAARVLLVEDNRFNQEVASAVLQRAGLVVELAVHGQQALALAQASQFDLILMDLQMPVMDGFDATRALRALPAYRTTPILALTANAFGETRAACLAAGMDDHIAKPISPQRLCEILARWLPDAGAAAPPAMAAAGDLVDSLRGIEGFDPAAGLALAGDESAFLHLLRQFIAAHEDGAPGLDKCLATGQRERARLMVHSLKGTSAAIGARALQQLASSCEAAIVRAEPVEMLRLLVFDLEYELVHLVGTLHDCLPQLAAPEPDEAESDMSEDQLEAAVESLSFLLSAGDYGALRLHRDIAPALRKAFGEAAVELAQAVRNHEHELALALIERLKAAPRGAGATNEELR